MRGTGPSRVRRARGASSRGTTTFRWDHLREPAAAHLGEPVLAGAPASPEPRRAPGFGAWGHAPLTGAQVRYIALTPTRLVAFTLDRDVRGEHLYRLLRIEDEAPRHDVTGVEVSGSLLARSLTVTLADGRRWELWVSRWRTGPWRAIVADLEGGRDPGDAGRQPA
ncbi:MAG: hypothetical protein M0P31_07550 [Solirubrobacteraceae bacterium]|nr:hypothetical protein [Solirubrobacteraceae bacterium]